MSPYPENGPESGPGGAADAGLPENEASAPAEGTPEQGRRESEPDYKDRWLRAEAELQNYRKRVAREFEQVRRGAEDGVILEMLPVLDDLERALEAARSSSADAGWTQGVALVAQRMRDALARLGVETVDPMGVAFDPAWHEAVLELPAPAGERAGTVLQVAARGYRRGERSLRAARVVVAREGAER